MLEAEAPKFGVGTLTPTFIERLSTIPENEIYPLTRFSDIIGYLSLVGNDLYLATCPTFTKPRANTTFSIYVLPYLEFCDYCNRIKHISKFGEVAYQFIYSLRIAPLASQIPSLQDVFTLITIQVGAPLH